MIYAMANRSDSTYIRPIRRVSGSFIIEDGKIVLNGYIFIYTCIIFVYWNVKITPVEKKIAISIPV